MAPSTRSLSIKGQQASRRHTLLHGRTMSEDRPLRSIASLPGLAITDVYIVNSYAYNMCMLWVFIANTKLHKNDSHIFRIAFLYQNTTFYCSHKNPVMQNILIAFSSMFWASSNLTNIFTMQWSIVHTLWLLILQYIIKPLIISTYIP